MKKFIVIITAGLLFLNSCDEFLTESDPLKLTQGNFYQTESELIAASNGIYANIYSIWGSLGLPYNYGELYAGGNSYIYEAVGTVSDNMSKCQIASTEATVAGDWNRHYKIVFNTNDFLAVLDGFDKSKLTPGLEEKMRAMALFVRGTAYYYLTEAFGDVPLVLKVLTPAEAKSQTRQPKSEVVAQAIKDLEYAVANLPATHPASEFGKPTKAAANAILARICMSNNLKDKAITACEAIVNSGLYSLDSDGNGTINAEDYSHVFNANTTSSKERILTLNFLEGPSSSGGYNNPEYTQNYIPGTAGAVIYLPDDPSKRTISTYGSGAATTSLINEFETGDVMRKQISAVEYLSTPAGAQLYKPHSAKFYWKFKGPISDIGSDVNVVRYSEIILNLAELKNDASLLNQVRKRAGLPGWGEAGYPTSKYPTLADAIAHERRVELSFEYVRGFDLKRTGKFVQVRSKELSDRLGSTVTLQSWQELWPIPFKETEITPGLLPNNQGY
jgi:hypothetical protein